ncbi:MAG: molybdopterin molybdotransferase MoeA [Mariniphaga sp.]|nr:molybdopterin molybdotransferase MoeA [Mariniphaga sp.]
MENQKLNIITLKQALTIAFENSVQMETEKISFDESLSRILAVDVFSDVDMPPFNKSAMDGYACRKEDLLNELTVLETIPAGSSPTLPITKNCCSKIMTGAEVPEGANTVFMIEQSEETATGKIQFTGSKTPSNICSVGEDLKKGSLVLTKGTQIKPQHIAMLAAVGCVHPEVYKQPGVGIISTGSELIEPQEKLSRSKIRNSNGHQIIAQMNSIGLNAKYYGIVKDDANETLNQILLSTKENDLTLISGGVSVGDFDFVPWAIQKAGFKILFKRLSIKPGQHTTFAVKEVNKKEKIYIIGLPGNPVSSFIQFKLFVKPFLYKLQNSELKQTIIPVQIAHDFKRKKTNRTEYLPVILNSENKVELVKYNGSAHIHAYLNAFGFITVNIGISEIKKGELVYVRPL